MHATGLNRLPPSTPPLPSPPPSRHVQLRRIFPTEPRSAQSRPRGADCCRRRRRSCQISISDTSLVRNIKTFILRDLSSEWVGPGLGLHRIAGRTEGLPYYAMQQCMRLIVHRATLFRQTGLHIQASIRHAQTRNRCGIRRHLTISWHPVHDAGLARTRPSFTSRKDGF